MRARGGRRRARAAFTLIELLVVTALSGLVLAAIGASLAAGIRAWDHARRFNMAEADLHLAMAHLRRDLANTVPFSGIPFSGDAVGLVLAGAVPAADAAPGGVGGAMVLGRIRYRWEGPGGRLLRETCPFAWDDRGGGDWRREQLADHVRAVDWQFGGRVDGAPGAALAWRQAWEANPTNRPLAVRVRVTCDDGGQPTVVGGTFSVGGWTEGG